MGTHRVIIDGQEKNVRWDDKKDTWLKTSRRVGFEQAAAIIEDDAALAVEDHWNPARYPTQRVYVLEIGGYVYLVPFVETPDEIFLKTIIPSRKATKRHLKGH